jgi:deoxycytidylate deaminase
MRLAKTGPCDIHHGAVIVKGGRVMSHGVNTFRNAPNASLPPGSVTEHAEEAALRILNGNARGAKIYIARVMKSGQTGLSRPCNRCYEAIVNAGIKEIIYT